MKNQGNHVGTNVLNRTIGGVALGLGATQLAAPRYVARLLGLRPNGLALGALRLCGVRESLSGIGLLSGRRAGGWLGTRVVGHVIDAGLLLGAMAGRRRFSSLLRRSRPKLGTALGAVGGVAALDVLAWALTRRLGRETGARGPARPSVRASITIDRSTADVYNFWRDVQSFPRFVPYLEQVKAIDRVRSHWRAKMPHGPAVEWDALIVDDRPEQRIAWKIETGIASSLLDSGEVRFEPAPGGQGTEVHLTLWGSRRRSPRLVTKWLRRLPERLWVTQLRRLKQLLELGEIVQSDSSSSLGPHPAQPSPLPGDREPLSPGMRESATIAEGSTS